MRRRSVYYRRFWYWKKNRRKLRVQITLAVSFLVFVVFIFLAESKLRHSVLEISEYKTKSIINNAVSNAVNESFPESINYEDIVIINRDEYNRVKSIQTDIVRLNRIFANLSLDIQENLSELKDQRISIPLGVIFGNSLFSAEGPRIKVKVIPSGSVETDFKSEFTSAGINQTRHRIYLEVKTKVGIVIPFTKKDTEIVTCIPVAETVIIGDVPIYYRGSGEDVYLDTYGY